MITLDAFLVFLGAASLPAIYVLILSRWLEPEYRQAYPDKTPRPQKVKSTGEHKLVHQPA